jgi:hypothetical protein
MTLIMTTFSIAIRQCKTYHNDTLLIVNASAECAVMLSVLIAECNSQVHFEKCCYAECRHAECRGASMTSSSGAFFPLLSKYKLFD